jgi:hypothetical protein
LREKGDTMTEEPLDQKVLSWLNTQGYGVEMKVATSLSAAGYEVLQSSFYSDPETGTSREIDVIGRKHDKVGLIYIYPVIECKKSSKPWVVFTSEQVSYNRIWSFGIMSDTAREAINNNIESMTKVDWFMNVGRVGYGITEAFTSREDETFKAGMTATKASLALLKRETTSSPRFMSFFFPTVVIDGRLFECYLKSDGSAVVAEIDSAFLLFPIILGQHTGSSIRIVTLATFDRYCQDLNAVYHSLKRELAGDITQLATSIGLRPEMLHDLLFD